MLFCKMLYFFLLISLTACSSLLELVVKEEIISDDIVNEALRGRQFRIIPDDYTSIKKLFYSIDPRRRQAGIILAEQADITAFYDDIFIVSNDEVPSVANEAIGAIKKHDLEYREYLIDVLNKTNSENRRQAIYLFGRIGNESDVPFLMNYFTDNDEVIRIQAAQAVYELTTRDNPVLRDGLKSMYPLVAAMTCRTLSYYEDVADEPDLISAFESPHIIVQQEAQLAVLKLSDSGLPLLHEVVLEQTNSKVKRLGALNVLQILKSRESVEPLFILLDDNTEEIRLRANGILISWGEISVPELIRLFSISNNSHRNRIVHLLQKIGGKKVIDFLANSLNDTSTEIREEISRILISFGNQVWETLHNIIEAGNPAIRIPAMTILRKTSDPWLLRNESGLFNLIEYSSIDDINSYLNSIGDADKNVRETIYELKGIIAEIEKYVDIQEEILSGKNVWLSIWQQGEIYENRAQESLRNSFDLLHEYFISREPDILNQSRKIRMESRDMAVQAQRQKNLLKELPESVRNNGQGKLNHYKTLHTKLFRTWESVKLTMPNVSRLIYMTHGINPESLYSL